jgi:hypothetical protein
MGDKLSKQRDKLGEGIAAHLNKGLDKTIGEEWEIN